MLGGVEALVSKQAWGRAQCCADEVHVVVGGGVEQPVPGGGALVGGVVCGGVGGDGAQVLGDFWGEPVLEQEALGADGFGEAVFEAAMKECECTEGSK